MNKISDAIRAARDLLTPETWNRGQYFAARNGKVCMCAHGAVQSQVNPKVRDILDCTGAIAHTAAVDADMHAPHRAATAAAFASTAAAQTSAASTQKIWGSRPSWVSNRDPIYGSLDAHYVLGMVGLTAFFNDSASFQGVHNKFTDAIKLAEVLGV